MIAIFFGDMAVLRGIYTEKSTTKGKDSSLKGSYTEVYAKRDGRWQCMRQYTTKLNEEVLRQAKAIEREIIQIDNKEY